MKIAILTYHNALNYGAILQTYALQKKLIDLGINSEILDYHCRQISINQNPFTLLKIIHFRSFFYGLFNNKISIPNKNSFKNFITHELIISKRFNRRNISNSNAIYDSFLVGSDQVWNLEMNNYDTTYLLDFTSKSKFSYASSLGIDLINQRQKYYYLKYLKDFKNVI